MKELILRACRGIIAVGCAVSFSVSITAAQEPVTLHGASHFTDDHPFNQLMLKFEELVRGCYSGPVEFVLHRNMESAQWESLRESTPSNNFIPSMCGAEALLRPDFFI